jgi:hypothetical protein
MSLNLKGTIMKKICLIGMCLLLSISVFARPKAHVSKPHHGPYKPHIHHGHHHHHYHHASSFLIGTAVGGLVSSVLTPAPIVTPATVVTTVPVVQQTRVWVPGYWTISYDNLGRKIKVWVPGYWTVK